MKTLARERDRGEILGRLGEVRPDSAPRWGRMSAHEMVCHLADAFRMATGERAVSPATGPFQRTLLKWIALYTPLPWGPGIRTRPEIDPKEGGTRPVDFAADVARVERLVEDLTARARDMDWPVHPIFGEMSATAWLRWGYRHMDHHLRQFGAGPRTGRPRR